MTDAITMTAVQSPDNSVFLAVVGESGNIAGIKIPFPLEVEELGPYLQMLASELTPVISPP